MRYWELMLWNTGQMLIMDEKDFHLAKHTKWFFIEGRIVTHEGVTFEDYVGIRGVKDKSHGRYDLRRCCYKP
jgi:hypothetical protein